MTMATVRYCVECWGWISISTSAACLIGWIIFKLSYPALSECNKCGRVFDDWDDDCICPGCKMAAPKLHRPTREITTEYWRN